MAKKARTRDRTVQDEFKRRQAENYAMREETLRRMDEARPTPTQDEMDEAAMSIAAGQGTIETEHDGVPEEERMVTPQSTGGADYETRDVSARRGGRPRKDASAEGNGTQ